MPVLMSKTDAVKFTMNALNTGQSILCFQFGLL